MDLFFLGSDLFFLGSETPKMINCKHVIVQRVVLLFFPLVYPKSPTKIVEITYGIIISGNFQEMIVQTILMCQKKSQQRGRG